MGTAAETKDLSHDTNDYGYLKYLHTRLEFVLSRSSTDQRCQSYNIIFSHLLAIIDLNLYFFSFYRKLNFFYNTSENLDDYRIIDPDYGLDRVSTTDQ